MDFFQLRYRSCCVGRIAATYKMQLQLPAFPLCNFLHLNFTIIKLNQKFNDARKLSREGKAITSLVKPSCLIIDEVGHCVFDKENTRMLFDLVDRRYNKDCPSTMIFTSNKSPDKWGEFFNEDATLLCTLDRIFDDAIVFMMKGDSYRGRTQKTIAIQAGQPAKIIE